MSIAGIIIHHTDRVMEELFRTHIANNSLSSRAFKY
ncbi:hypothetical protein Ark11_1597 [Candidatus Ichthyocystis hellenicum]|uniref:Uncharacterized protein n=1 Tax=Candidatus Ichthyocystis hellenicum TaxID=1561003 RepID=A0A0S4MA60_9BURK|nr:hypothetical protein Ark11_1597 [Candidatus Ichthyocystis hellenicum]